MSQMKEEHDALNRQKHNYSEEVRDIVDRMPTRWGMWTALITFILIGVVVILGFVIKYPDTVLGEITVTSESAPVRLSAQSSGRLRLVRRNGENLKKGDYVAYMESGVDYPDFLWLDRFLDTVDIHKSFMIPNRKLLLGDMTSAYNSFAQSKWKLDLLRHSGLYDNMRSSLREQIRADRALMESLLREREVKQELLDGTGKLLHEDSLLMQEKGISKEAYQSRRDEWLNRREACQNVESNRLVKEADISRSNLELVRTDIEEQEALLSAYSELESAFNALCNVVRLWKEHYLFVSPVSGELEYLGFWKEYAFVDAAQELFCIIPEEGRIVGEVYLSPSGAGKVKTGQEAGVKLMDYPYDEFGKLTGRVASVSMMTRKIGTQEGTAEVYLALIDFPDGAKTNFGQRLRLNPESKGTIEIITKPKRLIQRLFDNLKSKTEK